MYGSFWKFILYLTVVYISTCVILLNIQTPRSLSFVRRVFKIIVSQPCFIAR